MLKVSTGGMFYFSRAWLYTFMRTEVYISIHYFCVGKVVIDAFRLINPNMMVLGQEPRQTTSNLGHLQKPSVQVSAPKLLFEIENLFQLL